MTMKNIRVNNQFNGLEEDWVIMAGIIKAISTSKIKKITAIRKNRKEKGKRADLFGSKPHSNGDVFSRSNSVFFDKINDNNIKMVDKIKVNITIVRVIKIIYFEDQSFWLEVKYTIIY